MKPATDLSKVDLPQPDGPRRMNFSPRPTEKVKSSTAVNSPFSVGYEMVTPRTRSRSVMVYALGSPSAAPHPSVPRQPVERFEGGVAPGGRDSLDHADLVHERGELDEPRGRDGVPKTRLLHDL